MVLEQLSPASSRRRSGFVTAGQANAQARPVFLLRVNERSFVRYPSSTCHAPRSTATPRNLVPPGNAAKLQATATAVRLLRKELRTTYLPLHVVTTRFHSGRIWCRFCPSVSMVAVHMVPPATRAGMRAGRAGVLAVATLSRGQVCRHHSAASGCAFAAQTCRVASSFEAATLATAPAAQDALVAALLGEGGRLAARAATGALPPTFGARAGARSGRCQSYSGIAGAIPEHSFIDAARDVAPLSAAGLPMVDVSAAGTHAAHVSPTSWLPEAERRMPEQRPKRKPKPDRWQQQKQKREHS